LQVAIDKYVHNKKESIMEYILFAVIVIWLGYKMITKPNNGQSSTTPTRSYSEHVDDAMQELIEQGSVVGSDETPFKMKKNEIFLFSVSATLGTYKRNGNVGYGGVAVRIPIAKGVSFRAGGGKMGMQKSWVFDQPGELHVTTDRIVFNGENKNTSVNFTKVIDMSIVDKQQVLYIDKETGADLAFALDSWPDVDNMASAFLAQRGVLS
jgi:hypothetical protein